MQDSAEREARSEHPPADVEEAARRLLKWQEGRKFANADFFSTDQKMASDAIAVATAYLFERTRREEMEEALKKMLWLDDDDCPIYGEHDMRTIARSALESPQ